MKTRVTILAIVLVSTLVVGGVSAQEPVGQNAPGNEVIRVVQEQWALPAAPADVCPFGTACNFNGYAYYVRNDNAGGTGVLGWHNNAAGTAAGVYGETASAAPEAIATLGRVFPENAGANSAGVRGFNNGRGGAGIGVWGTQMGSGWGVLGNTPSGVGVYGYSGSYIGVQAASSTGWGLFGYHSSAAGTAAGVYGLTLSTAGGANAVQGIVSPTNAGSNSAAVRGQNNGTGAGGIGVWGSQNGSGWGVLGTAPRGWGVYGYSGSSLGVYGSSGSYIGVYGRTGRADNNWAGFFDGSVGVVNSLVAGAKFFRIDHPLDPANKYLNHASVESPDMMNMYNGNVALDKNGEAWVELPEWFGALNTDHRYQLTAIGAPGPNLYVAEQISNNRFKIAGGEAGMTVSWQVTGIRQDPYAKANPIAVEQDKPLAERGLYLHPELYGQPAEMGLSSLFQQWQLEGALTLEQEAFGFEALSPVPLLDQRMPGFGQGAPALFERPSSVPLLDGLERGPMQEGLELEEPSILLPELP